MLIVVTIVGILAAALVALSADSYRKTQLREGAVQLVADLNRARNQSQRASVDSVVTLAGTAARPSETHTTEWAGTPALSMTLPGPVRVAPFATSASLARYLAPYGEIPYREIPYGEIDPLGVIWEVSSLSTAARLYVRSVGVTGKVVLSAAPS